MFLFSINSNNCYFPWSLFQVFLGSFVQFLWDLSLGCDLLGSLCNLRLACLLWFPVLLWLIVVILACAAVGHWVEVSSVVTTTPWWVVIIFVAAISVRVAVAGGVTILPVTCATVGHWVEVSSVVTATPFWVVPLLIAAISVRVAVAGGVATIC